jgi:hypothetical protein
METSGPVRDCFAFLPVYKLITTFKIGADKRDEFIIRSCSAVAIVRA